MNGLSHPLILLTCLVLCLQGCNQNAPDYPARAIPAGLFEDDAQRTKGRQLFLEKCAFCHGKADEGRSARADAFQPPAPDFTGTAYRSLDPAYLFWRIEVGQNVEPYRSQGSVMPAWRAHFSDHQIWQLVAYLRSRAG